MNLLDELKKLEGLRKSGTITEDEFNNLKKELLSNKEASKESFAKDSFIQKQPKTEGRKKKGHKQKKQLFTQGSKIAIGLSVVLLIVMIIVDEGFDMPFFTIFLLGGILFLYSAIMYGIVSLLPHKFTSKYVSFVMLGLIVYLFITSNPFMSDLELLKSKIEKRTEQFCDCAEEARQANNVERETRDFLNCVTIYTTSWGEFNEWVIRYDLTESEEAELRRFLEKHHQIMDDCGQR